MQKKPKIEPPSTKSLKLLMDTRRKELENRKIMEESVRREDEQRKIKQQRLNDRVRSSSVIQGNKKQLEENRKMRQQEFESNLKENKKIYKDKLKIMYQKVDNQPLMMEEVGRKKDIQTMEQEDNI